MACLIKASLKIGCVRRFRHFQLLVSLLERLSPSLVIIVCETLVILIGCRILLAVHAGMREVVIRQIPLFVFPYLQLFRLLLVVSGNALAIFRSLGALPGNIQILLAFNPLGCGREGVAEKGEAYE